MYTECTVGTQIDQKRLCKRYIQVSRRRKFDFENESIDVPVVPKACVFRCGIGETQLYLFEFVYYHTDMNNVSFAAILILPTPLVYCGEE